MVEPVSFALVRQVREEVAQKLTAVRSARTQAGEGVPSTQEERQFALSLIAAAVRDLAQDHVVAGRALPDGMSDGRLAWAVEAAMFGAGPLQPLLEDEDLENLDLNGYDEVWATYSSRGRVRLPAVAESNQDLIDILRALASYAGPVARPWSTVHPQLDIGLPGGVRVSGLLAASERPQVSIRRDRLGPQAFLDVPPRRYANDAISLVELGTVDRQCALFLAAAVRARANIMIVGPTNAGKTTLLRAMANAVPSGERIITIEQALELRLGRDKSLHPNVVELETVLPSPDQKGGLDGADLVRRSKRMNPDRLIFGEVLAGEETRAMLEAMMQGTDGSMSTIHARNAYGAVARLIINLGSLREPIQPVTAAALIGQAVDFIVYVRQTGDSRRVVTEILEISGHQGESVSYATIFASPEPVHNSVPSLGTSGGAASGYGGSDDRSLDRVSRGASRNTSDHAVAGLPYAPARRDPRIPLRRAALLARHGYTDELGERLNAEAGGKSRRRPRASAQETGSSNGPASSTPITTPASPLTFDVPSPLNTKSQAATDPTQRHSDPAGIPQPLIEGSWGSDEHSGQSYDTVKTTLDLPEDADGQGEQGAHRLQGASLAPKFEPPEAAGGELFTSSRAAAGPIIDLGARRQSSTDSESATAGEKPASGPQPSTSPVVQREDLSDWESLEAAHVIGGQAVASGTVAEPRTGSLPTRRSIRERPRATALSATAESRNGWPDAAVSALDDGSNDENQFEHAEPEWKRLGLPRSEK